MSETARDFIDTLLHEVNLSEQTFEEQMIAHNPENLRHRIKDTVTNTNMVEVFVNYFIAATNNPSLSHLAHFLREMLHGVHSILPPPKIIKHQYQDPISHLKISIGRGNMDHNEGNIGVAY